MGRVRSSDRPVGLAHVATVSFLGSRLAPSGQFWVALGGGIALARAGQQHGARLGYAASCAAILETVALIGPARVNGPLTQALNAPLVGRLHGRGAGFVRELAACLLIRLAHYMALNALVIWLIVGGLDAYVASYEKVADLVRVLPRGEAAAIGLTVAANLAWALFYSVVQVLAYRRALGRWPQSGSEGDGRPAVVVGAARPRAPGRASWIAAGTVAAWVVLLAAPSWPVLAAVAGLLAVLVLGVPRRSPGGLRIALILAAVLALGALGPVLLGAVDSDEGGRRAIRAVLLVLTAAWARAAAGSEGIRELAGALLWRLGLRRAAALTAVLNSDSRLIPAARDLVERLRDVPTKPLPVADALTEWVVAESAAAPDGVPAT